MPSFGLAPYLPWQDRVLPFFGVSCIIQCSEMGDAVVEKTKILEAISKPQIAFEGKAGADDKAQHTRGVCEHFEEASNTAIGR